MGLISKAVSKSFISKVDIFDGFFIAGVGLISYGLHLIYHPAMFIFLGASLIFLSRAGSPKAGE